jgi:hypothetical protein
MDRRGRPDQQRYIRNAKQSRASCLKLDGYMVGNTWRLGPGPPFHDLVNPYVLEDVVLEVEGPVLENLVLATFLEDLDFFGRGDRAHTRRSRVVP